MRQIPTTEQKSRATPEPDKRLGLALSPVNSRPANLFGFQSRAGAVVLEVQPGSATDAAGLQTGDVVVSVDKQSIGQLQEFWRQVQGKERLLLMVERSRNLFFVTLKTPAAAG